MSKGLRVHHAKGERFGRLVIVAPSKTTGHQARWLVRCDCGREKVVAGGHLRAGRTKSCGCLRTETNRAKLSLFRSRRHSA